ncbi:transposase [Actinomadura luteofluorescens]|uniref:transposase n=1 Tax=Actinomadura luteofluorescens TaxID=46163 RepID=UPI003630E7DD
MFSLGSGPLGSPHLGLGLRAGLLKLLDGLLLGLIAFSLERRLGDEVCFFRRRRSDLRLLRRFILDQSFPGRRVLFRGLLVRDLVIAHPDVSDVIAHTSNVSPWPSQRNRLGSRTSSLRLVRPRAGRPARRPPGHPARRRPRAGQLGVAERARQDQTLTDTITKIHIRSRQTYSVPRVSTPSCEMTSGERVGGKRVARLMRTARFEGVTGAAGAG